MKQVILPDRKANTITLPERRESGSLHKVVAYATKDKIAVLVREEDSARAACFGFRYLDRLFRSQDRLYFMAETGDGAIENSLREANQTCFRREVFTFPTQLEFLKWAQAQIES